MERKEWEKNRKELVHVGERKEEVCVPGLKGHLIGAELTGVLTSDPVLIVVGELHQLRLMFLSRRK